MPRYVVSHDGLAGPNCTPQGAASTFFAEGGQVGTYVFTAMPTEERPLNYIYHLTARGGIPNFTPKEDLLYVTLAEEETPDAMIAVLTKHFMGLMPNRGFFAMPETEFVAYHEAIRLQQEAWMRRGDKNQKQ